jgi:hypothetical protein
MNEEQEDEFIIENNNWRKDMKNKELIILSDGTIATDWDIMAAIETLTKVLHKHERHPTESDIIAYIHATRGI